MLTKPSLVEARRYAKGALNDLTEDVYKYLALLAKLAHTPEDSDAYADLEPELAVAVTALRIHAEGAEEALEVVGDALPDND